MMHKATPGVHRTPRKRAEEIDDAAKFDGPSDATYDARGGLPRGAPGQGDYRCNVQGTLVQSPRPSKDTKSPIK